jgi:outer membrane protein assembly factor BamA
VLGFVLFYSFVITCRSGSGPRWPHGPSFANLGYNMTKQFGVAKVALLLLCSLPLLAQKKMPPQAIRFQGAPQYAQQELLAAAGLKSGTRLNSGEVKARAKQLNDTGLFKEVKFTLDSKTLLFTLTPSSQLFPMHLENVPLTPGKELDTRLQQRFPLYRSLLPSSGTMVDGICRIIEEMLAGKGVKATVKAALTSGLGPQKLTAVNFTVSPAVHIGRVQLAGVSPAMQAKASLLASGQTGNDFDTENTAAGLQHAFEDLYQDQGYAAVRVNVAQVDPFIVSDRSVDIPFTVTISEGGIYRLGTIELPASALVARADIEKKVAKYPPGSGRPLDLFLLAVRDAYNTRGYLDCSIALHPSFNEVTRIVNYSLDIAPGSQYRLASIKFDGAPDAMAGRLKLAWKMAPGDVFDESYLSSFAALAQKKDKPLAKWMQTVITTYDFKSDPATHEVNCIFHFDKAAQGPR